MTATRFGGPPTQTWAGDVTSRWALLLEEVRRRLGTGVPLDPAHRASFEGRLGRDLAGVAVHRGPLAGYLARGAAAAAMTVEGHVLGSNQDLDVQSPAGQALLAHELVHATQQVAPAALPASGGAPPASAPAVQRSASADPQEAAALAAERQLLQEASSPSQHPDDHQGAGAGPIDAEALADRVYGKLVAELQLHRERAAWPG